jgi:hypothetical protein
MSEQQNARGWKQHSSQFKGVSWSRTKKKWYACIRVAGEKTKSLGHFENEEEAARAYDHAAFSAWGDTAFLNFDFDPIDDFSRSLDEAYATIRERVKGGGPGWEPK